jgi:hypothetical protein
MPDTDGPSRPIRKNRTAVSTYNLKALANERFTQKPCRQRHHKQNTTSRHLPHQELTMALPSQQLNRSISSSLSSPLTSPRTSSVETSQHRIMADIVDANRNARNSVALQARDTPTAEDNMAQQASTYECFNKHGRPRGHYYSARELYSRGVWIGYLAPDKQKKPFLECPSYNELKANFANINLPYPPSNPSSSSCNREAVCRGCFGEQSMLLTTREISFAKNRV